MRGASSRSGPPPDPNALRRERDKDGDWLTLPPEGRKGSAPAWPLDEQDERESVLWEHEWTRPQAVMWERYGQEIEVAMYVRTLVAAEQKEAATNVRNLIRQQQEALGLSLPGLLRNRWRIEPPEPAEAHGKRRTPARSARERFTVVKSDAA
jgi:hypothetical protein